MLSNFALIFNTTIGVLLQLLELYKPSEPWIEASISTQKVASRRPTEHSAEDLEDVLFRSFLTTRFEPRYAADYICIIIWLYYFDILVLIRFLEC